MNVFLVVANAVLVVLTAAVVFFAWRTIREAKNTTEGLGDLLVAMREAAGAARETVAIAAAARAQAEFDQRMRALLDVGELVERIFWQASLTAGGPLPTGWRVAEQNLLQQALARAATALPEAERLAGGPGTAAGTMGAASSARAEVRAALDRLRQERP